MGIISQSIYDFLIGDPNIILFCIDLLGKRLFLCKKNPEVFFFKNGLLDFPYCKVPDSVLLPGQSS